MKLKNKGIIFSVWVLVFVLLAGCATVPESTRNPYLGYMYMCSIKGDKNFKQAEVEYQLSGYKKQIASEELQQRKNEFRGIYNVKSLDKMNKYVARLEEPISLGENQWKRSLRTLKKKERKTLVAYWNANKPIQFYGHEVLNEWSSALENGRFQVKNDTGIANKLELEIDRLREGNHFRAALEKEKVLRPYKLEQADELLKSIKKDAAEYWVEKRTLEIDELKRVDVYDDDHEQRVLSLYGRICDDVNVFGNRNSFNGTFLGWQNLLGENWRTRILKMGESKEYWDAYEFARERYNDYVDTLRFSKTYRDGLNLKIGKGYLEILDNAIRYYSEQASNAYKLKSLSGKAYAYCCMAKEMYDFSTVANFGYNEKTETWYKRISEFEKNELSKSLSSRVARRLVVSGFDLDMMGLSKKLRQSCREKYATGNDHAWSLEIVMAESEPIAIVPSDYVVEWGFVNFKVKGTYGTPIPKTAYVRTGRVKLVDNPFRKDKSSKLYKLKQVKSQEVDQYSLIESVRGIDLSCNTKIYCKYRGLKKMLKLPETEESIKKFNVRYGSVTNVTSTCSLPNVVSKMEYYSPKRYNNTIPLDKIPMNSIIPIPDDDVLKDALTVSIVQDLDNGLEGLIDMYPIELLADIDRDASSKYLDTLGTVLFYVANLSSKDAAKRESAGEGYEWLHLRDQVADNMEKWCGVNERWAAIGADEKMILRSLWEECIEVSKELEDR